MPLPYPIFIYTGPYEFQKLMIGWFKRQALLKHHKTCKNRMQIKYPKLVNVNKKPALKILC